MMLKVLVPECLSWRVGDEAGGKAVIVVTDADEDNVVVGCEEDGIDEDIDEGGGEVIARAEGDAPRLLDTPTTAFRDVMAGVGVGVGMAAAAGLAVGFPH